MSRLQSSLLSILRCPVTGSRLHQDNDELIGELPGPERQLLRYPIQDGIAILLPTEAYSSATEDRPSTPSHGENA
ncbi:hypothetical protein FHU41_002802 [Psychromicrobium silvestre]|uniref:Uncharacterized protein n=1 Tax=Psychromicrobium silvestre TaxID=1645614 RepID=A0A7Y9LVU4_9MICC|nr:Trm112 family protein [Psychromicrobium silvestre]NYE96552.1 hypothetical protein [Psychromicrobium silvestre]